MDRGYESYNLLAHFQENNWFYLIRIRDGNCSIKSSFNFPDSPCFDQDCQLRLCRKQTTVMKQLYRDNPNHYRFISSTTPFDFLPVTNRKYDPRAFYTIHFRIVRLEIAPGNYETLITNTTYSAEELKNLYNRRWGIETSFRNLKYSIGLVNFHAKKKEGILQEIFARFTNFNFCQWLISQITIQKPYRKQNYKICFSDAAYACRLFLNGRLSSFKLRAFLERQLAIIRPNRLFKRQIRTHSAVSFTYRIS